MPNPSLTTPDISADRMKSPKFWGYVPPELPAATLVNRVGCFCPDPAHAQGVDRAENQSRLNHLSPEEKSFYV
jgi:hypothetical protein